MSRRSTAAVALVAVLILAGCSAGYQPKATGPPDPAAGESLGYYDGYWHNDTLDVDASDGLTEAEREAVFARAMARVQLLRGLEFREDVEIELITREAFREEYGDVAAPDPPAGVRVIDNAQHEALFLVGSDQDVVQVRQGNRGDLVLGFYRPGDGSITLVSEADTPTLPNERTLAHELVHALQDQRFGLAARRNGTLDAVNAKGGLVEGSAGVVEREYQRNCETGEWECVGAGTGASPSSPREGFHFGVYFVDFFPYAEGPTFVEYHRDRGGWDAVDAMHDDPPTASAEVIHPETYGAGAYGRATLEDRSGDAWERVRTGRGDHATVGQAGLAAMFAYTAFESPREGVIDRDEFRNVGDGGRLDDRRPFAYDVAYAEGWYADRLHAYERGDEVALVWNVTFDGEANAAEFRDGYERVVEYWGGEERRSASDANAAVWTLDGPAFRGAVWIEHDGNSVTVVKAPSVDALGEVYGPAAA